jgi:hypothetical protein
MAATEGRGVVDAVGILTAGAALLAAGLSAVTLFTSGDREHRKWIRESALTTLVEFLDASFEHNGAAARLCRDRSALTDAAVHELGASAIAAHARETYALTRVRLLLPRPVVTAAESLHTAEHVLSDLAFIEAVVPEDPRFDEAIENCRRARLRFIQASRSVLETGPAAEVTHRHVSTRWNEFVANHEGRVKERAPSVMPPASPPGSRPARQADPRPPIF